MPERIKCQVYRAAKHVPWACRRYRTCFSIRSDKQQGARLPFDRRSFSQRPNSNARGVYKCKARLVAATHRNPVNGFRAAVSDEHRLSGYDGARLNIWFTLPVLVGNGNRYERVRAFPSAAFVEPDRNVAMHRETSEVVGRFLADDPARFVEDH